MNARPLATLSLLALGIWIASCSSGLGNDPRNRNRAPAGATETNPNLPLGLDLGVILTAAAAEPAIAGVVVPAIGATPAREVVLLAFSTAAVSNNGDGAGTLLARDTTSDSNGADDIFVAAVSAQDVERRAFSQSLAGKFRHPRCRTCHMMQAADTQSFVSSGIGFGELHAGPPPGTGFPNNAPEICAPCHVTSNTFPVVGWMAPAASFDMRPKTVEQLADMARNVPADETEHFVTDRRVLWALDSGILPQVGGRNGFADDDHDGIVEPEDRDGVPRTVPGGSVNFLRDVEDWRATATPGVPDSEVDTTHAAVKDVTLVSRASGTSNAGNGASTAPQVKWVPNPAFDPANVVATNPIGTLFVVFQSTSSNLAAGDVNPTMDVFRAAVELRAEQDATGATLVGGLNLVTLNSTILCSARNGTSTTTAGTAASGRPTIGGTNAEFIAFESLATDLITPTVFTDGNGAASPDVYLRNVGAAGAGTSTLLVSHLVATPGSGGNGASERPSLAADGSAIAFESAASDLINGDGNAQSDVFFASTAASPFVKTRASVTGVGLEGTGGACRNASVHSASGRTRVAFESDKTDLATGLVAPTNVFLFDSNTGTTQLLNRRVSPGITAAGDGSARAPAFFPDGSAIAFESDAGNLDVLRTDSNGTTDVFLVETEQLDAGRVLPFRISMTANEVASGDGPSTRPIVGSFTGSANFETGFAAYQTAATNLGTSDSTNVMVSFLAETSGILVDFSAVPAAGRAPLQVQFTDASTGTPSGWEWDFTNDGIVDSTAQNPVTTYTTPGDFTVKLLVRNSNTEAENIATAFVHVTGQVTADFVATPATTGGAPLTVLFTDASAEPNGTISAWAWDFDNNGTTDSTVQNPSHVYTTPGTFSVTLTATGENSSATVTKTNLVTVTAPGALVASFTSAVSASPVGGRVGTAVGSVYDDETVLFTDTSAGTVTSRLWNFGDGTTSTLPNPTHVFATPGTYNVFLTVTDATGADSEVKPALITSIGGETMLTITASKDTTIYSNIVNSCNPANPEIAAGRPYNGSDQGVRRALLEFDVAGSIPATSVIVAATLDLQCTRAGGLSPELNPRSFTLHRVTQEWGEVGTTPGGAVGGGGVGQAPPAAVAGDATWSSPTHPAPAWAGGTRDALQSSSANVASLGAYNWPTSAKMVSDVQGWMTPADNHGWILIGVEGLGTTATARAFASRTHSTATPPRLTVTFRPPLP